MKNKVTTTKIAQMKEQGEKITALAVYDYLFAALADRAGIDILLVGDSLGMTFQGGDNTLKVTMDHIAYHTSAVQKGVERALLVADMPFMSFRLGVGKTLENAGRLISEGAEAVKVEGAKGVDHVVKELVTAGIPVMGHVGLTPQLIHSLGGFKVQGQAPEAVRRLMEDVALLEESGVFSIVLECVPSDVGEIIASKAKVPIIGIGAGPSCDGQILVATDVLGLSSGPAPKFVKKYADLGDIAGKALASFSREVRNESFPSEPYCYKTAHRKLKAI